MSRVAIILSIIAMMLASPAHAEFKTLPGVTDQIAVTRVGCFITVDGKELMHGTCHHRITDSAEMFMTLPEAATQIVVYLDRRSRVNWGIRLWSRSADGKERREFLGSRRPLKAQVDGCHANDRVRICFWSLETPPERQPPAPPLDPSVKQFPEQLIELNRLLEKHTGTPPVR